MLSTLPPGGHDDLPAGLLDPNCRSAGLGSHVGPKAAARAWIDQMTRQSRRRESASPAVPPVPGALGLPAVPASKPARRRAARLARTLRTRWWPRFLLTGVLVVVVGATLVSGEAALWVMFA